MMYFIFAGDMLVMGFMIILVVWLFLRGDQSFLDEQANIPLRDESIDD